MGRIHYKLKKFKNSTSQFNNYYYPRAVMIDKIGTDALAGLISKRCTITKADVLGCLAALSEVMNEQITDSKSVKLAGIGTFSAKLRTAGMVKDLKEFNPNSHIKGYGVNFLPEFVLDGGVRTTKLLVGAHVTEEGTYASGVNDTQKVGGKYVPIKVGEVTD